MKHRFCCIFIITLLTWSILFSTSVLAEDSGSVHHYASALMEAESGTLLDGRDSDVRLPVGSLTKLMTVYLTAEAVETGRFTLDTELSAPPSATW